MLVVITVLFSLVVALAAAFVSYAVRGDFLAALVMGGSAFVAVMTLALGVYTVLLP
ncbi:hypothetical protein RM550_26115 [Streptomyces sp. DSM 41527]|uniref:NADH-quinone oxidoreductase subunit J n=1 Tax=Streptomyces mooreae TaxID=3075523 RepID=A0ABU2TE04_9ACTN|nr:hypothetical protein [Streptomyces sp. DSM 41527]MDT0459150.1 hypothetical protein [Streptomyces sp. DSM 41527]